MPFAKFKLHPDLLRGVKDLGFTRATPIQEQAIPPALEGRDLLACAMTGSGKTAAFLLPILNRLMGKPRGTTRALILTPTRELAAQIEDHLKQLAVHTPLSGAAIFGGVGMGPQEHAFRSGVDVLIATPGRLLDHFKHPYAKLDRLEVLVLDEADRMLDMGFLPDIRRVLKHLPARRQTLFFSATMPGPIQALSRELLHKPASINLERRSAPAVGIRQAVYAVREDYIHRVGRTARAEATGDAFTLVSPEEEQDLAAIERAIGKRLPRVVVPGFDYASKPQQRFEVPIAERIAEIRARKA